MHLSVFLCEKYSKESHNKKVSWIKKLVDMLMMMMTKMMGGWKVNIRMNKHDSDFSPNEIVIAYYYLFYNSRKTKNTKGTHTKIALKLYLIECSRNEFVKI